MAKSEKMTDIIHTIPSTVLQAGALSIAKNVIIVGSFETKKLDVIPMKNIFACFSLFCHSVMIFMSMVDG